jgi:hypothetical protein
LSKNWGKKEPGEGFNMAPFDFVYTRIHNT